MAAASAQPIALPTNPTAAAANDFPIGSLTGQNGSFNPASYRRFMGSPMSFRAGSFGSRFYPGVSPGQLFGPLDPNDFRFGKMSSSIESDRGSLINNALNVFERQDELCRDYQCCGVNLTDMHALVDHFEECHVVVVDPYAPQGAYSASPSSSNAASSSQPSSSTHGASSSNVTPQAHPQQQHPQHTPQQQPQGQQQQMSYFPDPSASNPAQPPSYHQGSFDPDDMELDVESTSAPSSGSSSPPDTPISTPLSAYPTAGSMNMGVSGLYGNAPVSAFDTTTVLPSRALAAFPGTNGARFSANGAVVREDAFNAYAGYADYSAMLPGTGDDAMLGMNMSMGGNMNVGLGMGMGYPNGRTGCVPPALLLNSTTTSPADTPDSSRVASPVGGVGNFPAASQSQPTLPSQQTQSQAAASTSAQAQAAQQQQQAGPRISTTLSRPATSLLLSKPFKCPKPNCNKSYKQANGLKYHMTHGSCNFAPPKDLEQIQALLASKRRDKEERMREQMRLNVQAGGAPPPEGAGAEEIDVALSDAELREVEREAERRLRPYACGVGECQRRYKNMNGLRYHYQHSGDHGAIGLALLASGQHECLQHTRSRHNTPASSQRASPQRTTMSPQRSMAVASPRTPQPQPVQPVANYATATAYQHQHQHQYSMSVPASPTQAQAHAHAHAQQVQMQQQQQSMQQQSIQQQQQMQQQQQQVPQQQQGQQQMQMQYMVPMQAQQAQH